MGDDRILVFLFFSYCTNKGSFTNYLRESFKHSQMFFGVRGFFGRRILTCETTGLTLLNT